MEQAVIPAIIILAVAISVLKKKWMAMPVFAIANFVIFIYMVVLESSAGAAYGPNQSIQGSAYYTVLLNSAFVPARLGDISALPSLVTSMFLHVDFMHVVGNLIFLVFLGLALEERAGKTNFIIIYFVTGLGGTLSHWASDPSSTTPALGASGAIFGIGGALLILYPREKILLPIPLGVIMLLRRVEAWIAIGLMALFEMATLLFYPDGGVSYYAHLGGLATGMAIAPLLVERRASATATSRARREKLDFAAMRRLASTDAERRLLDDIEKETIEDVRNAWLEQFWANMKCQRCGQPLAHEGKKTIQCYNCGAEYGIYL